ncbi:MAG: hypothetical protein ACLFTT_00790 [Candidatus Hydrogenedentota bacterium]
MHKPIARLLICLIAGPAVFAQESPDPPFEANVPVRQLTGGPQAHWFGYYDKEQFSPDNRYVLGATVGFEDRTPNPDDAIALGMVDTQDGDKWIPIGETRAWSWQQGCMLQWVPGTDSEIIYNDREGDTFIAYVQDVFTGERRKLERAIYAVSPDGKRAVGTDFARIDDTRPGYGYKGGVDPGADQLVPDDGGIYVVDLETGAAKDIITYEQIAAIPQEAETNGRHWFNHLLFNTNGERFIFLHRAYREPPKEGRWVTRMFTAAPDGSDLYTVNDHGMVSHFIWKNAQQILAWAHEPDTGNHFYLYTDQSAEKEVIGPEVLTRDGHCTYGPKGEWILTDTYPDSERMQHLMLYRPSDNKLVKLGKFYHPRVSDNEWRTDLHPRWDRKGKYVCIDSLCSGQRQLYLIDVGSVLAEE